MFDKLASAIRPARQTALKDLPATMTQIDSKEVYTFTAIATVFSNKFRLPNNVNLMVIHNINEPFKLGLTYHGLVTVDIHPSMLDDEHYVNEKAKELVTEFALVHYLVHTEDLTDPLVNQTLDEIQYDYAADDFNYDCHRERSL